MSSFDIDDLLREVSPDTPCGEDLEYDSAFGELERSAQGKAEQQIGDSIIEAEEPDWREVQKLSLALFSRTKDIRVAVYLTRASLKISGYLGLRDGLTLLERLLQQYWDGVYPELDADDNNDPTMRINALVTLCDEQMMLQPLRQSPLVSSRMMGRFGLRDLAIAAGHLQPADPSETVDMAAINAAFMDADPEELQITVDAVNQSIEAINHIETFITEQVGVANAASFADLLSVLKEANQALSEQLAKRGIGTQEESEPAEGEGDTTDSAAPKKSAALSGEINSREDVIRALNKIQDYYSKYEPTSPLPLLMERSKKLVNMSFMEIIQNMAPDGLSQIEAIKGPNEYE
jgi:type VI secretion system protein ImpA